MPYNLYINGIDLQILLWWFPVNISSQALTTVIQTVLTAYLQCIYTFPCSIAFSVHISILCMVANWDLHDEVFVLNFLKTLLENPPLSQVWKNSGVQIANLSWKYTVSSLVLVEVHHVFASRCLWGICKLMKVWGQKAELGYHPRASEGGRLYLLYCLLTAPWVSESVCKLSTKVYCAKHSLTSSGGK